MGLLNRKLTEREKAAVYMHVFGGVNDWELLYAVADQKDGKIDPAAKGNNYPSKWKNTPKIQDYIKQLEKDRTIALDQEYKRGLQDGKNSVLDNVPTENETGGKKAKVVDYSDPTNQARKLNELVNTASDPGEALDALKVIIQTQKADREAARDQKTVRAYLPLSCYSCPLYEKARKKGGKQ